VTDDPEFVWRVPWARFLVRATGEAAKPDTAGQEQVAWALPEALGHFGIDAKVVGREGLIAGVDVRRGPTNDASVSGVRADRCSRARPSRARLRTAGQTGCW
jgi:hypothetical protein